MKTYIALALFNLFVSSNAICDCNTSEDILYLLQDVILGERAYMWTELPQLGVFVRRGYLTEQRLVHSERKCSQLHESITWPIFLRCREVVDRNGKT